MESTRVRRRWDRAVRYCGFTHPFPISKIERREDGYHACIAIGKGRSLRDLNLQKDRLAAEMGIGELWFDRDPANAGKGTAMMTIVVQNDYLTDAAKTSWPLPKPPKS
jgi:hypothetical protein